jgi:hypothetical protein
MNQPSYAPTVSHDLLMQVVLDDEGRVTLPAVFSYDAQDPFAVSVTFRTGEGEITWIFARDLLRDGLTERVGEGDILIRPAHPSRGPLVLFTLSSPSGSARLEGKRDDLRAFVDDCFEALPAGSEWQYVQVDRVIDELLADG